jgi:hypothetical protein
MTSLTTSPLVSVVTLAIAPTISRVSITRVLASKTMTALAVPGSRHEKIGTAQSAPVRVVTAIAAVAMACAGPTETVPARQAVPAGAVATVKTERGSASAG